MHLLGLPPEIFHLIVEICVASIEHDCDIKLLQLVNSENSSKIPYPSQYNIDKCLEFFYQAVTEALCITHHPFIFNNLNFKSHYFQHWVFSLNTCDNYLQHTIKYVTRQFMKHKASSPEDQKQIPLDVPRAAIDFMVPGLYQILQGKTPSEIKPPCQDDPDYIHQLDWYGFNQSMQHGVGLTSDIPVHVLSAAAYLGDISLVKHLLVQDVDVNARSNIFWQPLRNAALKGHLAIVRLLLDKGADAEGGSYPRTEEDRQAVERQYSKEYLEQHFPEISQLPDTAVEAAAKKGHKEILQLLLQPNFHVSRSTYSYRRALIFGVERGDAGILKILAVTADYSNISEISLQKLWNYMLRYAAFYGKTEIIPLLLDNGAQVNNEHMDLAICTPLGLAAFNGHTQTILLLLQKGANINGGWDKPLCMAIWNGFAHTVKLLLGQGAEVDPVVSRLLDKAVVYGEADVVRISLGRGTYQLLVALTEGNMHWNVHNQLGMSVL